jgi:replicative DNA helicase
MGIPAGPVIIDHLGIIRPEKERQGSKHAEIADISRGLAEMAKRLDVPVIALCQLNRGVEGREDKRPILADLRQAGELEEDSRLVIFMFRPEYYFRPPQDPGAETHEQRVERETKLARNRNKLFWLIEKNNNGPLGHVETFCDVACSVVRDRAQPGISGPYRAVTH